MALFNLGSFGDGNPYTVFSHDLKSVLTSVPNGAWNNLLTVGSGLSPTTDPELGTKFIDTNGADTGYRFNVLNTANSQLDNEGHFKIKVERQWLCAPELSSNGNSGDLLAGTSQTVASMQPVVGPALLFLSNASSSNAGCYVPAAGATVTKIDKDFRNHKVTASVASAVLHTAGKSRFVEVDIFWKGKFAFYAVDGEVVNATGSRSLVGWDRWLQNFYLGSNRGSSGTFLNNYFVKDMEIRTKCPEFALNYDNRNIGVLSDSLFDSEPVSALTAGDVSAQHRIQRKFNKQGQYVNINISENGGYLVHDLGIGYNWLGYASATPDAHPTAPATPIVSALATNPKRVLVSGGTNDALYTGTPVTSTQFQNAAMDILEKLLGENGNPTTTVETVYWLIPIPLMGAQNDASYATYVAKAAEFRDVLLSLDKLWDTTYPAKAGAVKILNSFDALGGESEKMGNDLYKGQLTGTLTDLHLGAHGMQIWGDFIAGEL